MQAVWRHSRCCDLVVATGDIVAAAQTHASNRPYIIFLSAHSSYYQGRVDFGLILWQLLCSEKCLAVFTRDALTAAELNRQGLNKAQFVANPVMDNLNSTGKDLQLIPRVRTIALLPGSRLREATNNLVVLLEMVKEIATNSTVPVQFWAALVPALMPQLDDIAARSRWQHRSGKLIFPALKRSFSDEKFEVEVICSADAFAALLQQSSLVIGMTGTAVEQAVGLGKPVNAVPGNGPVFTYRFAEAQNRLLGDSVQVIGTQPANSHIIKETALAVDRTLQDNKYLANCIKNSLERMGRSGGSIKIANYVANYLGY